MKRAKNHPIACHATHRLLLCYSKRRARMARRKMPKHFRKNSFQIRPFITLDKALLAFGHVALLDHADFQLDEGERVGLIGRNGGGKSSMMRVLANQGNLDDGLVWRAPTARICYVSQEPVLDANDTVFDAVAQGLGKLQRLLHDYHHVSHQLAEPDADFDKLLEQTQHLQTPLA